MNTNMLLNNEAGIDFFIVFGAAVTQLKIY